MGELNNPWKDLKGGKLQIEGEAPKKAAEYAANLLDYIDAIKGNVQDVVSYKGFPTLIPSGRRLQQKFFDAGERFQTRIKEHETVLVDMGEAFLAAQKTYTGTEENAKTDFANWRKDSKAADGLSKAPKDGNQKRPEWGGKYRKDGAGEYKPPSNLTDVAGRKDRDTSVVDTEPVQWMNPERAYQIWTASLNDYGLVEAGAIWRWMAGHLDEGFSIFNSDITTLLGGEWKGDGAGRAKEALTGYKDNGAKLAADAKIIGDNLYNLSGWLWTFTANLTNIPPANMSDSTRREVDELAKWSFQHWYIPGVETASNAIPWFPETVDPIKGKPTPPPQQPTTPGTPGTPSGPGGPGASSPAGRQNQQLQQQLAQQRQAAEQSRKAIEQQQRLAEQQRKAMEDAQRKAEQDAQRRAVQQQQQAAQQAAQQAGQQMAQQAAQAAQQLGQQAASAAQQMAQQAAGLAGLPGIPNLKDLEEQAKKSATAAAAKGGGGASAGGAGGAGVGGKPLGGQTLDKASKLFPRAAVAEAAMAARTAGIAPGAGMAGMPMGGAPMGGAGGAAGGQQREHKRADYLDSTEHIDDAIGEAPIVAKPVVEQ